MNAALVKDVDVTLVFPPLTEARLFPYLSLPNITAYLRQRGHRVAPRDLNIELCHRLFSIEQLDERIGIHRQTLAAAGDAADSLRSAYRVEMAQYIREHHAELCAGVWDKHERSEVQRQHDVRFVRQGVELLLEGSRLAARVESIAELVELVDAPLELVHDPAASLLHTLVSESLERSRPRVLGLSVAFFSQLLPALLIARWVRERAPEIHIVLGGQQIMNWHAVLAQQLRLRQWVDSLGLGPGEGCLDGLIRCLRGELERDAVPDLIWLEDRALASPPPPPPRPVPHINDLPAPDFSDLPIHAYLAEEPHLAIITCVGCSWGRCVFCSYGNRSHRARSYQQASPLHIADICQTLVERHDLHRINFVDENTPLRVVLAAMRILNERGVSIRFSTRNRLVPQLRELEFCRELAARGCVLMSIGYETNSQRLLDALDKGVCADDFQTIIDNLDSVGITLRFSVMGGVLDETPAERDASEAFLAANADKIGIDIMQMLVMEPGTYLADRPEAYGLHVDSRDRLRGNSLLNYGQGRMGYQFNYPDGDSFNRRLEAFVGIHSKVAPQKNDELPPARRTGIQRPVPDACDPVALQLWPWVRVLRQADDAVLADLLWQRVFALPGSWRLRPDALLVPQTRDEQHLAVMRSIIRQGLVAGVHEESLP